mmetsp:Transcript_10143/g.21946  ORF Transcript_10143/g.21946 Transcript_10143/m.21946 type:complete len:101 (+) Transcript_10143:394-696(+)
MNHVVLIGVCHCPYLGGHWTSSTEIRPGCLLAVSMCEHSSYLIFVQIALRLRPDASISQHSCDFIVTLLPRKERKIVRSLNQRTSNVAMIPHGASCSSST